MDIIESLEKQSLSVYDVRSRIIGLEKEVPLLNGNTHQYVNFDNAATTPTFKAVLKKFETYLEWYGSVHRGTGFKSLLSTSVYEQCRAKIKQFVGADTKDHVAIFTSNTTSAINKLCHHFQLQENEAILLTTIEHHSNMLPWRVNCPVEYVEVFDEEGYFSCEQLERKLYNCKKKIRLVAITGDSNVTGSMPPLKEISQIVHNYGAEILVDAAQLIACRPVNMLSPDHVERIDYLVFSAHKIYAPFGVGVLIGPKKTFINSRPDLVGGGTVDLVTLDEIKWTTLPEREEAGTPNLIGVVALVKAIDVLQEIGWDFIKSHNLLLTNKLLAELNNFEEITIYGNRQPDSQIDRGGVVAFNVKSMPHALLASILGYEWGIGVRNGCFCAQPYVIKLLGLNAQDIKHYSERIRKGEHASKPGMVRVSFGIYNTVEEIDYFIKALKTILKEGSQVNYLIDSQTGEYFPEKNFLDFSQYFSL